MRGDIGAGLGVLFAAVLGTIILLPAVILPAWDVKQYQGYTEMPRAEAFELATEQTQGLTILGDSDPVSVTYDFQSNKNYPNLTVTGSHHIISIILSAALGFLYILGLILITIPIIRNTI